MRGLARVAVAVVVVASIGCAPRPHRVVLDPAQLVGGALAPVACPHRLVDISDARPAGGGAGGFGKRQFFIEDGAALLRGRLAGAGLRPEGAGPGVAVRLLQLYMSQNVTTKVPVAVLGIRVSDGDAFVIRSQLAGMAWSGSEDEAHAAYARALDDATAQLVRRLDAGCGADPRDGSDVRD